MTRQWWREPNNKKVVNKLLSYGITTYQELTLREVRALLYDLWARDFDPEAGIDNLVEAIGHAYTKLRREAHEVKGIREL